MASYNYFPASKVVAPILFLFILALSLSAQQAAFPGAEGYGKYASGGRGGQVYEVTNLEDSGPGSLRDAVSQSDRTVVFRVSGNIELQSELVIRGNNLTIAGQTAPGEGICVRDYPTKIDGNNIIIRYLRFRLGDRHGLSSDALHMNGQDHVILDHCTMSWGVDECFSAYGNTNVTVQWCMIGEGLNLKGHSMGGLWGGHTTYHHNLVHTNNTRHPKYAYTYDEDITDSRNNVIYNWGYNSAYTSPTGRVNLVNNYYKAGPATGSGVADRIVQAEPTKRMYIAGNYVAGFPGISADNWNGGVDPLNGGLPVRYDVPFEVPNPLPVQDAMDAYREIVLHGGASFPMRDDADNRAIKNLVDSTGEILIRQGDAGGFPSLFSAPAPADRDHDGMPDDYETGLGLDPDDPDDRNGDADGNGYTNLEDYLNGLLVHGTGMPRPGFFRSEAVSESRILLHWFDLNSDEKGYLLERSTDSLVFSPLETLPPDTESYQDEAVEAHTTYYYRMRSFTDADSSAWTFTRAATTFAAGEKPGAAMMLSPADGQVEVPVSGTDLLWESGPYTLSFNVYLGKNGEAPSLVDSATTATTFKTGLLDFSTDYSWRIDAQNENGITPGETRVFTTLDAAEPELLLYWPFLEEGGTMVYDSTPHHNDGILQNIPVLPRGEGPFRRSVSLLHSRTQGHIEVADNLSIAFDDGPFSIAFWMRASTVSDSSIYIFHKGAFQSTGGTERNGKWFGLEMRDGAFRFSVDDNSKKTVVGSNTSGFVTGQWVHVAVVRDVYKGRLYLYRNGNISATAGDNTGGVRVNMPLRIGNSDHMYPQYYGGSTDENTPYRGELAEFVICGHPLSRQEVGELYRYNRIPTLDPPAGTWQEGGLSGLRTFPNPFSEEVWVEFRNRAQNNLVLEVYDMKGSLVGRQDEAVIPHARNRICWTPGPGQLEAGGLFLLQLRDPRGEVLGRAVLIRQQKP